MEPNKVMISFDCKFCSLQFKNLDEYIEHYVIHSSLTKRLYCGIKSCQYNFKDKFELQMHIIRVHNVTIENNISKTRLMKGDEYGKFVCTVSRCAKEFDKFSSLVSHLRQHINVNEEIICPYDKCKSKYCKINSFSSHLSKIHKKNEVLIINETRIAEKSNDISNCREITGSTIDNPNEQNHISQFPVNDILQNSAQSEINESINDYDKSNDNYVENMAILFLKLESQFMIPVSIVQNIVSEFHNIHLLGENIMKTKLKKILLGLKLSPQEVENNISHIVAGDPFNAGHNLLKTSFKRKKFYALNFNYIEPVSILIDPNKQSCFLYIPIEKTLQSFFIDKSINDSIILTGHANNDENDTLKDFTDGSAYKQNQFFQLNPKSLKIIIFQDAFEIVNPLGSAKKKYKAIGIYLALGNLPNHIRYNTNNIKLIALCKEKEFNHEKVYGKMVEDLKKIEDVGILINNEYIKGSVVFISGDNLGSHGLGGFVENFSTAEYFCRYCLVTRSLYYSENRVFDTYDKRNITQHNNAIAQLEVHKDYQGIKFQSIFNNLNYFNVCSGLPPCLGHDLLEGIVAYDMYLLIQQLVKEKWFSINEINNCIRKFNYTSKDLRDKPCEISLHSKRIVGAAIQILNFLRLFPLMFKNQLLNPNHDTWHCILLLSEIVEIVISPSINKRMICYLQVIISEFIALRQSLFPNNKLRPKHHYLQHYPNLILAYGPLIKVWTLRFESKHMYFKKVARHIHNFINVLKTLAEKHELYQSLVRLGSNHRQNEEVYDVTNAHLHLYNNEIKQSVENCKISDKNLQECSKILVKGTLYEKGCMLLIRQDDYQYNLIMGKVILFLLDKNNIYVVLEVFNCEFHPEIRAFELQSAASYECHNFHNLVDYKPISVYKIGSILYAKPDHAYVS